MPLPPDGKQLVLSQYRDSLARYGSGPEAVRWSPDGQRFRFDKLMEIGDLKGKTVLDVGCGTGDLYPRLCDRFGNVSYTGIDIVPEFIQLAQRRFPELTFQCRDILSSELEETYDWVLMSGVFNLPIPDGGQILCDLVASAFRHCRAGIGFNFTSTVVNFTQPEMAYHNPIEVLEFCVQHLSPKVTLHHHYRNCDVAIFVFR